MIQMPCEAGSRSDTPRMVPVSTNQRATVSTVDRVQEYMDHVRNPTVLVLLGLAVVWALVLTPDLVRMYRQTTSRRPTGLRSVTQPVSRRSSSGTMGGIASPSTRSSGSALTSMSRTQAQQRRSMVLFALLVLCVLTLMGGVLMGGSVWGVHLALDAALVGYVYLLATRAQSERASNAQRASRTVRRQADQQRPSYLQRPAAPAPIMGAVGEVFYLDDARPGNAVAGYVDEAYPAEPAAYYEDEYAPVANYEDYVVEAAYYDEAPVADGYNEKWAEPHQQLPRSVGW